LVFETVDLAKAEFRIDRQAAANGGRLDGSQGRHKNILNGLSFDRLCQWIGSENELGGTVFPSNTAAGRGAIEATAGQLPKRWGRFFAMPDADDAFPLAWRRRKKPLSWFVR